MKETNFQWTICLVLIALSKGVKPISEVTMTLSKKRKFDIWPKQGFLRSFVGYLENVFSQHNTIRVLKAM